MSGENLQWMPGCQACNNGIVTEVNRLKEAGKSEREACRLMVLQQEAKYGVVVYDHMAIRSRYRAAAGIDKPKRVPPMKPKPTVWQRLARAFDDMPVQIEQVTRDNPAANLKQDAKALETVKKRAVIVITFLLRMGVDVRGIVDKYEGKI